MNCNIKSDVSAEDIFEMDSQDPFLVRAREENDG